MPPTFPLPDRNCPVYLRVIKIIDTPLIEIIDRIFGSRRGLRVPVASFSCPGFLGDGIGRAVAT